MHKVSGNHPETTGNDWKPIASDNRKRIEDALVGVKREALADEVHVSPGQLSKLLNGEIARFCDVCGLIGLTIVPVSYIEGMEAVLREKL